MSASSSRLPMEASSSSRVPLRDESNRPDIRDVVHHIPSSFYTLPTAAAILGFFIGARRGGSRARLRFLAENAHRQPTTKEGWYYYMKTRNYRMIYAGGKTGFKYGVILAAGTGLYATLDESFGWAREEYLDICAPRPPQSVRLKQRITWKRGETKVYDGMLAGTVLAMVVGILWRFPRPVFVRSIGLGAIMGGIESSAQIVRDHIGNSMLQGDAQTAKGEAEPPDDQTTTPSLASEVVPISLVVDGEAENGAELESQSGVEDAKGWRRRLKGWIPGLG